MLEARPHPLLAEIEARAHSDGVPIVSPETGALLSVLVHAMQANRILEIGTGYGYATLAMARAQPPAGKIWSIEPQTARTEVARGFIERAGLAERVEFLATPALESLAAFPQHNLDIAFVDAERADYRAELELLVPRLKRSGLAIFYGCLETDEAVRHFTEHLLARTDLDATILPLGSGIAIGARVR